MIINKSLKTGLLAAVLLTVGVTPKVSAQSPVTPPAEYNPSTIKVNYIRTWDVVYPTIYENALLTAPVRDVRQATQYFDGMGDPLQTVIKQGSLETGATATDLVNPVTYDEFGREVYKYLPFASNIIGSYTNTSDGTFKLNPFLQQAAFMTAQYGGQGETFFYNKTNFEASPTNRAEKIMAAGNNWVGGDRGVEAKYWINTVVDDVKIWGVNNSGTTGVFGTYAVQTNINNGVYAAGELFKNVIVDEHGKQVIEFKDKEGKVILKKVQLTATADDGTGRNHDNWLCTYYIYDDLGNLRCVIQPEGVKELPTAGWQLSSVLLNEQCFRYEYDAKNRIIMKKVPGAGEVYMVYDARDLLVMTQDANMRAGNKWMVTKYDGFNRPEEMGLWENTSSFATHLINAYSSTNYPTTGSNYEELSKTFYDSYSWLSGYGNPLPSSYTNSYDTYFQSASNVSWPYAQANVQSSQLKGLATGSRVKVLGSSTFLYTVSFYDEKGKVIQVQGTNITGGVDVNTTQYSWAGQPLIVVNKQEKGGIGAQTTVMVTQLTYDDLGRLAKTEKKLSNTNVNSGSMSVYKTIAENEYDKLGQLKKKKLAPAYNSSAGLETLNYEYNIRGWMLGMNRDYARDANSTNYFGFDLGYDKTNNNLVNGQSYTAAQYNGNITGLVWKSRGDGEKRKYDFSYDAANRLLKADFTQYSSSTFNQSAGVNFNMKMGDGSDVNSAYDYNGNIKRMQQWGLKITGSTQIDDLKYTYETNSNKLKSVTDFTNDAQTKLGDFRTAATHPQAAAKSALTINSSQSSFEAITDFSYDVNGNLNFDNNKAISSISYNHLNLPSVITVTGKGTITYTYDAAGNKLKKVTDEPASSANGNTHTITTTSYIGGAVYESKSVNSINSYTDKLQFIGLEEGRIRYKEQTGSIAASMQYDYMLKDHLGNVRMVLTEEQKQDKYPVASMEDAKIATEDDYYTIDQSKIVTASGLSQPPPTYTNDNGIGNNPSDPTFEQTNSQKFYQLNSGTNKTGLGIALKVTTGDRIDIFGKSYWYQSNTGGSSVNTAPAVLDLLNGLLGTPTGATAGGHATATELNGVSGVTGPMGTFIGNSTRDNISYPYRPKAFINYIFLDEQFKPVDGNQGFSSVSNTAGLKDHYTELQNLTAQKSGYVYIYVSNESPVNVFFDNLQAVHTRSPILEETHYYPFGLTMNGISSKALNGAAENKYKFNDGTELSNKEFGDGSGLELYETPFRGYDPQIGRFWQIDAMADEFDLWSPYVFAINNPCLLNDPTGLEPDCEDCPTGNLAKEQALGMVTVRGTRKAPPGLGMINTEGTTVIKNPNISPFDDDVYKRQQYLSYRAWTPNYQAKNNDAVMIENAIEVITWVVPWSKVWKGAKWIWALSKTKQLIGIAKFLYASKYGIKAYKTLRALNTTAKTQVHHLFEKRFASILGQKSDDMLSIVLSEEEHAVFTKAWRAEIGYKNSNAVITTATATVTDVQNAARKIYKDYPEILNALGL